MGWSLSDFGKSIDLTNPDSNLSKGLLGTSATVYQLADSAFLGALPNELAGTNMYPGQIAPPTTMAQEAAKTLGQLPVDLSAGLPQTGSNLGQGVGNLGYYSLTGIGAGAGNAIGSVGEGTGSLFGDLGQGLGKGLLPIALIVFGGLALLILLTRGRKINVSGHGGSIA